MSEPEFDPLHDVNVGPGGTYRASGEHATTPDDVDALVRRLRDEGAEHVVVHLHGGLIDEAEGVAIARRLQPVYEGAGAYPVAFIWETGLGETLQRNLASIARTRLFKKLVAYALKEALKRMGGVGGRGAGGPLSVDEIEAELEKIDAGLDDPENGPVPFEGGAGAVADVDAAARGGAAAVREADLDWAEGEIAAELEVDLADDPAFRQAFEEEAVRSPFLDGDLTAGVGPAEGGRGGPLTWAKLAFRLARVAVRVVRRFLRGRDHGTLPTVVEEVLREFYVSDVGQWVWGGMKTAAEAMWAPNDGLAGDDRHVGTDVLAGLAALQAERPALRVTVVAHSAGSVAAAHLLRVAAARHPALRLHTLLFLAPALRLDLFLRDVVGRAGQYDRFRMFTMTDEYEARDPVHPRIRAVYPRSLLYFISGVLEDEADAPIAGMARYLEPAYAGGAFDDLRRFLQAEDRLALAVSADGTAAGLRTGSATDGISHGGFDDDALTRESLQHLIRA